jgi:hypothetical protein
VLTSISRSRVARRSERRCVRAAEGEQGLATVGRNVGAEVEIAGEAFAHGVLVCVGRSLASKVAEDSAYQEPTVSFALPVREERMGSSRPAESRVTRRRMSATQRCVCWLVRIRVLDKTSAPSYP